MSGLLSACTPPVAVARYPERQHAAQPQRRHCALTGGFWRMRAWGYGDILSDHVSVLQEA